MDHSTLRTVLSALGLLSAVFTARAADVPAGQKADTTVSARSDEGNKAMERFRVAPGLKVSLFASEPDLANPVSIATDEKGRWYVAETFRLHAGVPDIRGLMSWLDDDLACRTVEDRIAMHFKFEGQKAKERAINPDRVRLIEDRDGDGVVDHSTIFAEGFDKIEDGIGSGVLARKGSVYYTNIPSLWMLKDTDGDGKADVKKALHSGYGIRVGFLGHDLHGLRIGPDGRLYFTIGDRGMNVKTERGEVKALDSGACLRCDLDGNNLEIFATGLRNPQELAFDQYGNLFTGDNNCDHGDPAKFYYLVEGADCGWRVGYQHLSGAGPWNAEKIWATADQSTSYSVTPPIAHIAAGPSGLAYYPGTGLPSKYDNHFLLVDFRGGQTGSGIHSFTVKPKGAGFELTDRAQFIWDVLAVDVEFGVDGAVYFCDWVNGWGMPGKGRIYKVFDEVVSKSAVVKQTQSFISQGFEKRDNDFLVGLLTHPDMRVRQEAQFEFVARGEKSAVYLEAIACGKGSRLPRLHAIWGLGQLARNKSDLARPLMVLLESQDDEIRAQAVKVLGDAKYAPARPPLISLLKDPSARVRLFAALALSKVGDSSAVAPLLNLLADNANKDHFIRHAAVTALAKLAGADELARQSNHPSPAVRMGITLALRRLHSPLVAPFLDDPDAAIALEAARAINDEPINEAMPQLARQIDKPKLTWPVYQRALNANLREGTAANVSALLAAAGRAEASEKLRIEALKLLQEWDRPSGRDYVIGVWRPIASRDAKVPADTVGPVVNTILKSAPDAVRLEALKLGEKHNVLEAGLLYSLSTDKLRSADLRAAALGAMERKNDARLPEAVDLALIDKSPTLRREAIRLQVRFPDAVSRLEKFLAEGSISDQQAVLATLANVDAPAVAQIISHELDLLSTGKLAPELQLDLLETAAKSRDAVVKKKLADYNAGREAAGKMAQFSETLAGGDAKRGEKIFRDKSEVSCVRCHKVGKDGGEVGPNLSDVGKQKDRVYLLESILLPNKQIAPGFEGVIVKVLKPKKKTYNGVLKAESADELSIDIPDVGLVKVKKSDIISRERGPSAMVEELEKQLTRRELRDLIEYLANQKG